MRPFVLALVYTWCQDNSDDMVSFFFLRLQAFYLPLLMLGMDLLLAGQQGFICSLTGYLAAHMYLFFDYLYPASGGPRLIATPALFKAVFRPAGRAGAGVSTGYGTVFNSRGREGQSSGTSASSASSSSASGSASGFGRFALSSSDTFRGKGRRLGD